MFAIIAGAFGAHGLRDVLTPHFLDIYKTAVQYHFYVGCIGFMFSLADVRTISLVILYVGGFIFCGTLYCLSLTGILWLGAITPIGGSLLIFALLCQAYFFSKR